jgi:PAS domain S-box-containing protein
MSADPDHEELKRLAALARLQVLDTPEEEALDRITRLAAQLFAVPFAAITFFDQGREWFKSRFGFDLHEVPREYSLCDLAGESGRVAVVPDARADPRFARTALVVGPPHLRFYAGAPLVTHEGRTVGIISIGDRQPRSGLTAAETDRLRDLAAITMDAVEQQLLNAALDQERRMLREQRRLAELIVNGSAEGIFAVDRDLRCTLWNETMVKLSGLPAAEVLGRDILSMNWPLATDRPDRALRSALAGRAVALRDEVYRDASGEERFFAAHFSPLQDTEGQLVGAIGFVRDTTERHELEDQLRQAQKLDAIGLLTGTVAHDFNNILTVLIGNAARALARAQDNPRLTRILEEMMEGAERGEKLTQQLLAFARRQCLEPQPVDINALVARTSDMLRRTMPETIELRLDLSPGLPRATSDPHQLEVALLNLALNAQAAMPNGGTLTIETGSRHLTRAQLGARSPPDPGRFVMIAIRDTGAGIKPEVKRRMFEPFFTTKSRGQGTGLGLSQVYGFVMQSLGRVRVESHVGQGTTVELDLPATTVAAEHGAVPADEPEARESRPMVLVVEDSTQVRDLAKAVLQEHGYRVLESENAEEALRCLHQNSDIDLVFSDVIMPGRRNGLDLTRELRRTRPELPVILATGYTDLLRDIEREGFPLLLKPYRPTQLARIVEEALRAKTPRG